jgi:AcrR family transcriptional regulator
VRDAILAAGLRAFLRDGVANAPIQHIAADAGVSIGGLYHHFGDKRGLAAAIYATALADYQRTFLAALEGQSAEAGVRATVAAHLDWCLRAQPSQARFLLFHPDAAGDVKALNRPFFGAVLDWWRPHVRSRTMRDLDFDLAYALWLGPVQEYCRLRLAGRTRTEPKTHLADAAWAALKGDTP